MKCLACFLLAINIAFGKANTRGCRDDMTLFGPDKQYHCNCKELDFCDFKNNGKCRNATCKFGYAGPFCQKKLYHKYLTNNTNQQQKIFTNNKKEINNSLIIHFKLKYRIHLIKIKCQTSVSAATVTLFIGSVKFCEEKCQQLTNCQGDASGKYLLINTTDKISLSNMKILGCSSFWFGKNCDKQCHCANNSDCHMITGNCPMGCETGRRGSDCQTLNYLNVALNKKAWQSSTHFASQILMNNTCKSITPFKLTANLAVDGNTDQQHERLSCMLTDFEVNPKWNVDLGRKYNISQMRIYYQKDKLWHLPGIQINIDNQFCYNIKTATKITDIKCSKMIYGRIIELKKRKQGSLNICEVEVLKCLDGFYGNRCNNSCPECKNSSCDQWSGQCLLGCKLGYQYHPNKTCTLCPLGTFSEQCSQTCHCKNDSNCNRKDGTCEPKGCEIGYKGDTCQEFDYVMIIGCDVGALILLLTTATAGCVIFKRLKRTKEREYSNVLHNPHSSAVGIQPDVPERNREILARNNNNNFVSRENPSENTTENTDVDFQNDNRNMENVYNYILPDYIEIN